MTTLETAIFEQEKAEAEASRTLCVLLQCGEKALAAQKEYEELQKTYLNYKNDELLVAYETNQINGKNAEIRKLQVADFIAELEDSTLYNEMKAAEEKQGLANQELDQASQFHRLAKRILSSRETITRALTDPA